MTIEKYIKEYTNGDRVRFTRIWDEFVEMLEEVIQLNWPEIEEEFQDVTHFVQLWLYWRFGVNGEIWKMTKGSVQKFMNRRKVWRQIYKFVGLPQDISNFCGNYQKQVKVTKQLAKFGISKEKAEKAYEAVVNTPPSPPLPDKKSGQAKRG